MRHFVLAALLLASASPAQPPGHEGDARKNAFAAVVGGAAAPFLPPEKKPVVLDKVEDLQRRFGEESCEGRYYGLFTKPAPVRNITDEWRREDFKGSETAFLGMQRAFEGSALFQKLRKDSPDIAREWALRLSRARFEMSPNEGAFARFVDAEGDAIGEEKDLLGNPVKKLLGRDGRSTGTPTVLWKGGVSTPDSKHAKHFQLAHEATHLMNWAPPVVQACLVKPEAAAARKGVSDRDLNRPGATDFTAAEQAFMKAAWGTSTLEAEKTPAIARDAKRFRELWAACRPRGGGRLEGFGRYRDLELELERIRPSLLERLELDPELRRRLLEEVVPKKEEKPKMDTRSGWGTAPFVAFEDCLKTDTVTALELFGLVKKYRLPGFESSSLFADQRIETVADFYATELSVEELEALPADQRKAAAEDILRSFPPTRYPDDARAALDYVGSKKTNEGRVFGILLANPKFREALGCKFAKVTPKYCGE